ncbi:MAG TPA: hypothetical protein VLB75_13165 [Steroidobacteraceae bacterium]|nr:hypothetical protein [Steroidobacteraceae bacterium]
MTFQHDGRFSLIDPGTRPAAVVLRHAPARSEGRVEAIFGRVAQHDLPAVLDGVVIRTQAARGMPFVVRSAGRDFSVHAQSLRIHAGVALYGGVLPQARFPFTQRVLWALLLWSARFRWGQALIRRMRG